MHKLIFFFAVSLFMLPLVRPAAGQGGLGAVVSPSPADEEETKSDDEEKTTPAAKKPRPDAAAGAEEAAPAAAIADKDRVQKIVEAGLQFDVPKDWKLEVKPCPAGNAYRVMSKDGATFAFIPTSEADAADRLAAMRSAVEKQAKSLKAGQEKTNTVNGLSYTYRTDTVDNGDGVMVSGTIRSKTPVLFMRAGDKAPMQANAATLDRIFHSVKASE